MGIFRPLFVEVPIPVRPIRQFRPLGVFGTISKLIVLYKRGRL